MSELHVEPPVPDAVQAAIRAALVEQGVGLDGRHAGYTSPWRAAAVREAVENEPSRLREGRVPDGDESYTLSPRSTRGATRA